MIPGLYLHWCSFKLRYLVWRHMSPVPVLFSYFEKQK